MSLAWDSDRDRVVVEALEATETEGVSDPAEAVEADPSLGMLRVSLSGARRGRSSCGPRPSSRPAGPPCPFCGDPLDPVRPRLPARQRVPALTSGRGHVGGGHEQRGGGDAGDPRHRPRARRTRPPLAELLVARRGRGARPAGPGLQRHAAGPGRPRRARHPRGLQARARASARCGTSRTARSPTARWPTRVVCEALGWDTVPLTVARPDGPFGEGSVQVWVDEVEDAPLVDVRRAGRGRRRLARRPAGRGRARASPSLLVHRDEPALRRMALLDAVCNNADRKGGHVLRGAGGRGPRRRPRAHLQRRRQAAHRAVGLGRASRSRSPERDVARRARRAAGPRRPAGGAAATRCCASTRSSGPGSGSPSCSRRAPCPTRRAAGRPSPGRRSDRP